MPDVDAKSVQDLVVEVEYWRGRALAAEARVGELESRLAELTEQVATLTKILFGRSSEKTPPAAGDTSNPDTDNPETGRGGESPKRGQRQGSKGHGRRDYAHLETEDIYHDVSEDEKCCRECGAAYSPYGEETCQGHRQSRRA